MSDSVNNNTPEEAKNTFEIGVDQDAKLRFPTLASSKLDSTDYLCEITNSMLKPIFADWKGAVVKYNPNNGRLYLSLMFDQTIPVADGEIRGFEPLGSVNEESNSGLKRVLNLEQRQKAGNKFAITDTAKSGLARFIAKDGRNNEVNWKTTGLVTQEFDPKNNVTRNVINFIDPRAILREVFGTKINVFLGNDENGNPNFEEHEVDYQIIVLRPIYLNNNDDSRPEEGPFEIEIKQIDKVELIDSQHKLGVREVGRRIITSTL